MPDQVRSYHRAFNHELLIHRFGSGNSSIRPYRPIPVRAVAWTVAFILCAFVAVHLARVQLPMMTIPWAFVYLVLPIAAGWLFSAGEIEGRRLHVVAPVWVRHVTSPRRLVGGYRPETPGPERLKARRKVRVR